MDLLTPIVDGGCGFSAGGRLRFVRPNPQRSNARMGTPDHVAILAPVPTPIEEQR